MFIKTLVCKSSIHSKAFLAEKDGHWIIQTLHCHQNNFHTIVIKIKILTLVYISHGLALMADATNMSLLNWGFAPRTAHLKVFIPIIIITM